MSAERKNLIEVNGAYGCLLSLFVVVGALGGVLYLAGLLIDVFR